MQRCRPAGDRRPWRVVTAGFVLFAATLLAGCASFRGYPAPALPPDDDLAGLLPTINAQATVDCVSAPSETCRDRVVRGRMYAEDIRFWQFEEKVFVESRQVGFSATLATLGLTTAGAALTGGATQVLSGLAAVVTGSREAFQKEIFAERTVVALLTAMRARRAEVALRLRSGLQQPVAQYPVEQGLSDVGEYRRAGTVAAALSEITEAVGTKARAAEVELKERFSYHPDTATQRLRLMVCGEPVQCSAPKKEAVDQVKARCWPSLAVPPGTAWADFMFQERFARERVQAAACMGL